MKIGQTMFFLLEKYNTTLVSSNVLHINLFSVATVQKLFKMLILTLFSRFYSKARKLFVFPVYDSDYLIMSIVYESKWLWKHKKVASLFVRNLKKLKILSLIFYCAKSSEKKHSFYWYMSKNTNVWIDFRIVSGSSKFVLKNKQLLNKCII